MVPLGPGAGGGSSPLSEGLLPTVPATQSRPGGRSCFAPWANPEMGEQPPAPEGRAPGREACGRHRGPRVPVQPSCRQLPSPERVRQATSWRSSFGSSQHPPLSHAGTSTVPTVPARRV